PTTEFYTLSLHDALPILAGLRRALVEMVDHPAQRRFHQLVAAHAGVEVFLLDQVDRLRGGVARSRREASPRARASPAPTRAQPRSEEHTSELQSPCNLVC